MTFHSHMLLLLLQRSLLCHASFLACFLPRGTQHRLLLLLWDKRRLPRPASSRALGMSVETHRVPSNSHTLPIHQPFHRIKGGLCRHRRRRRAGGACRGGRQIATAATGLRRCLRMGSDVARGHVIGPSADVLGGGKTDATSKLGASEVVRGIRGGGGKGGGST